MGEILLVDDRTGRVLFEVADPIEALRVVDELQVDDPELADSLCLVSFDERGGVLVGTESTTRVHLLT